MAYGNNFPIGYNGYMMPQMQQVPQIPQVPQVPPQQQTQNQNGSPMIWVQGETGAKSYLLAPNTTLPLWDSERQTIYLKSADASGMPSMKILDYTIRDNSSPQVPIQNEEKNDYVTHEELKKFEEEIKSQIKKVKKDDK